MMRLITDLDLINITLMYCGHDKKKNLDVLSDTLHQAQNLIALDECFEKQIQGLQHERWCHSGNQEWEPLGTSRRLPVSWLMG